MNFLKKKNEDKAKEEKLFVASQWQLIRWKFVRHRLAMGALGVLLILYFFVILSEFTSPYDPRGYDVRLIDCPPQRIHFFDEEGHFHLRPFVYGVKTKLDKITLRKTYVENRTKKYLLYFFVKGDPYKLWGLFGGNLHLFGTKEGKVYLFGGDTMGRDMLSRIIYGGEYLYL